MCYKKIICPHCSSLNLKNNGKTRNKKQKYQCKDCRRQFITDYSYQGCRREISSLIVKMTLNGSGIRDISRVLAISTNTILKAIRLAAGKLPPLRPPNHAQTVELDEFWSFVGKKKNQRWTWLGLTRGDAAHRSGGSRQTHRCQLSETAGEISKESRQTVRFRRLAVISEVCAFGATLHRKRQNAANRKEKSELSHSLETIRAQDNCLFKERENA